MEYYLPGGPMPEALAEESVHAVYIHPLVPDWLKISDLDHPITLSRAIKSNLPRIKASLIDARIEYCFENGGSIHDVVLDKTDDELLDGMMSKVVALFDIIEERPLVEGHDSQMAHDRFSILAAATWYETGGIYQPEDLVMSGILHSYRAMCADSTPVGETPPIAETA